MKKLLIIVFVLITILTLEQAKGQMYSKIEIDYTKGGYPFGNIGRYEIREKIIIKPLDNNFYKLDKYIKTEKFVISNHSTKTTNKIESFNSQFDTLFINSFIKSLTTDNYPLNSTSFNSEEFLKNITLRKIKKIARKDDLDWLFEKFNKNDTLEINYYLREVKKNESLDSFLISLQQPREFFDFIVIDSYHDFQIKIFNNRDSILYSSNLWNNKCWGQPFIDKYKANLDTMITSNNSVFNLEINKYLLKILPENSEARSNFEINRFINCYLEWYIKKIHNEYSNKKTGS